jgi:hypothetical protein
MSNTALPYLRKQSTLLAEFKTKLRVTGVTPRWSNAEFYLGMNEAIETWNEMVRVPYWYDLPDGFAAGTDHYTLPAYIRPPVRIEVRRPIPFNNWGVEGSDYEWTEIGGRIEPDGEGGQVLRTYSPTKSLEGRIGFYAPNSVLPYTTTLPVTSGSTSASATSVLLSTVVEPIQDVGHIEIGSEKIAYFGVTRGTATTTLNGLVRGLYGTTAAIHNTASTVEWCVAVDDLALYTQLFNYTAYVLHRTFQVAGGTQERENHQKMMLFHKGEADAFWQGYTPQRPKPRMVLGRRKFALRR